MCGKRFATPKNSRTDATSTWGAKKPAPPAATSTSIRPPHCLSKADPAEATSRRPTPISEGEHAAAIKQTHKIATRKVHAIHQDTTRGGLCRCAENVSRPQKIREPTQHRHGAQRSRHHRPPQALQYAPHTCLSKVEPAEATSRRPTPISEGEHAAAKADTRDRHTQSSREPAIDLVATKRPHNFNMPHYSQ